MGEIKNSEEFAAAFAEAVGISPGPLMEAFELVTAAAHARGRVEGIEEAIVAVDNVPDYFGIDGAIAAIRALKSNA